MDTQTDPPLYSASPESPPKISLPPTPKPPSSDPSLSRAFAIEWSRAGMKDWRIVDGVVRGTWTVPNLTMHDVISLHPSDSFADLENKLAQRLFVRFQHIGLDPVALPFREMKVGIGVEPGDATGLIKRVVWTDWNRENGDDVLRLLWQKDGRIIVCFLPERPPTVEEIREKEKKRASAAKVGQQNQTKVKEGHGQCNKGGPKTCCVQ